MGTAFLINKWGFLCVQHPGVILGMPLPEDQEMPAKNVLSAAGGQARCTFPPDHGVPFQRCGMMAQQSCKLLCFQRPGTAALLNREALGYLQEPLVNEDFNGDNCTSTKAISYFIPISAVLNHQPGPCLLQCKETHL